jgi:hypothetical protein
MSYLAYFLYKTNAPSNFSRLVHNLRLDDEVYLDLDLHKKVNCKYSFWEMKFIMTKINDTINIETYAMDSNMLVKNADASFGYNGILVKSKIFYGFGETYDTELDNSYYVKMFNEINSKENIKNYWDVVETNNDLQLFEIDGSFRGVLSDPVEKNSFKEVKFKMGCVDKYFKNNVTIKHVDFLKDINESLICYYCDDDTQCNELASSIINDELNGKVLFVDYGANKMTKRRFDEIIAYSYRKDRQKYGENNIKKMMEMFTRQGFNV